MVYSLKKVVEGQNNLVAAEVVVAVAAVVVAVEEVSSHSCWEEDNKE